MAKSLQLKEEGNRRFQAGDYVKAEALYSQALIVDPTNPTLYTNRAMARLRLAQWDNAIADCNECLRLSPDSMKAHYNLSQAHLALRAYDDALKHALRAHELCVKQADKSLATITNHVLKCKKERWEAMEKKRLREISGLEGEVMAVLQRERDRLLQDESLTEIQRKELEDEWQSKLERMREVFERARPKEEKKRVVPDWAIDDISFCVMVDPVITKTGKSYERASIVEHLRRTQTDPLTREPLYISDLRPNLDLKQACEEFLAENGWAADW
ncbi:uncharacterized protein CTHT_0036200 [Thermochaetoides thermophila DSM 1495]|uniref:E3 ubiquitin-protein ligase CHIP n=1 Tax=Chaetomium thermophilum (strain DSM 1495 / CBS 144.50 / IMI 039719) TaxID=759272 RepID=G0S7A9_CHATD|nr:hypothetical protein CTHT_0036200 [Thermochaetoides thermophila DSM 1495]EGS21753.1 hypothetical protein CTHT_0036200 [Thermochaetoides thermophila DSM 1495]